MKIFSCPSDRVSDIADIPRVSPKEADPRKSIPVYQVPIFFQIEKYQGFGRISSEDWCFGDNQGFLMEMLEGQQSSDAAVVQPAGAFSLATPHCTASHQ